jgi:hypothetical protein
VRELAVLKRDAIQAQLQAMQKMHTELGDLLGLCDGRAEHCPILETLDAT